MGKPDKKKTIRTAETALECMVRENLKLLGIINGEQLATDRETWRGIVEVVWAYKA